MGCSGSKDKNDVKQRRKKKSPSTSKNQQEPTDDGKVVKLDEAILHKVLSQDGTILNLDLQNTDAHKDFMNTVHSGKNGALYDRFSDMDTVEILLDDKNKDSINEKFVDVIKHQFPANISKFVLKSLAKNPESLKPYIEGLKFAKTMIKDEFWTKNLAIDGVTFGTVLAANFATHKITFFGTTFSELDKVAIDASVWYSIQELSFEFCKGLNDSNCNIKAIIDAIGKNKDLSSSLKTITLRFNKLEGEDDIKDALEKVNLGAVKLLYKEASKTPKKSQETTKNVNQSNKHDTEEDEEDADEGEAEEESDEDESEDEDDESNQEDEDE